MMDWKPKTDLEKSFQKLYNDRASKYIENGFKKFVEDNTYYESGDPHYGWELGSSLYETLRNEYHKRTNLNFSTKSDYDTMKNNESKKSDEELLSNAEEFYAMIESLLNALDKTTPSLKNAKGRQTSAATSVNQPQGTGWRPTSGNLSEITLQGLINRALKEGYVETNPITASGSGDALGVGKFFYEKLCEKCKEHNESTTELKEGENEEETLDNIIDGSRELMEKLDNLNTSKNENVNNASASAQETPPPAPPVNAGQMAQQGAQGGYQTPVQQQRTQGSQPATATPTRKPRVRLAPPPRPATQGGQTQVPPIDATTNNNIGTPNNVGESIASLSSINNNKFNTMPRTQSASAGVPFENGGYPQGEQGDNNNNNENEVNANSQVASESSKNDNDSVDSKETDTSKTDDPKEMLGILYDNIVSKSGKMKKPKEIKKKKYYLDMYDSSKGTVDSLIELTRQLYFAWGFGDGFSSQIISTLLSYVLEYEGEEVSEKKFFDLISYVDKKFNELCNNLDAGGETPYKFRDSLQLETASIEQTERELVKQCRDFDRLNSNVKIGPLESCENVEELFESLKKLVNNLKTYSAAYSEEKKAEEYKLSLNDKQNEFINEGNCKDWKIQDEKTIREVLFSMDAILQSTRECIDEIKEKEKINDHSTLGRKTVSLNKDLIKKFNAKLQKLCDALNEKIPDKDKVSCSKARDIDKIVRQELYLLKKIRKYDDEDVTIKSKINSVIKSVSDNLNRLQEEGLTRKNYKDIVTKTNKALKDIGVIIEYLSYHDDGKRVEKIKKIINNSVERMNILIKHSGLKNINFEEDCNGDLRKLNENMENAYAQMLEYPGLGLEKSWEQISGEPGESEKLIERNLGYVADVVSAIREPKNASPEVEQPKENIMKRAFVKLKSVFEKKPKNSKLTKADIQTCFKAAGSYFKKAYDAAEKEKDSKKKDKHFTAAGLIKNFSALKKTGWYGDFKGMLEGTKTTVKSSKDGKKGDILLCKLFISFLGLESAENVKAACTGFMNSTIEGKPKDICSVIRSKCLGGIKKNDLKTQLEKILTTGNDKKISSNKFTIIAGYFKNSSWFDNEKKSEENEPQPEQEAIMPVALPLPARNAKLPPPSSPFPGNGQSGK